MIPARPSASVWLAKPVFGAARSEHGQARLSQPFRIGPCRVAHADKDPARSRNRPFRRAPEMTSAEGRDGFEITRQTTGRSGGPSIRLGAGISTRFAPGAGRLPGTAAGIINPVTGDGPEPNQPGGRGACSQGLSLRAQVS